jgi:amino acid transporter
MLGYLAADLMVTPRRLVAFARDGLMHGVLARLHARSKAPHIAISGTFAALAVLATLTSAALYVIVYVEGVAAGSPWHRPSASMEWWARSR